MILFLDFDGVTHPHPCKSNTFFCHLDRIEGVLRDYPNVQVVISSGWRHKEPFDELRGLFSEDIQPRVIGVTPPVVFDTDAVIAVASSRHSECLAWMAENGYTGHWVALDDAVGEFPAMCPNLIECLTDVGFEDMAEADLRLYLAVNS